MTKMMLKQIESNVFCESFFGGATSKIAIHRFNIFDGKEQIGLIQRFTGSKHWELFYHPIQIQKSPFASAGGALGELGRIHSASPEEKRDMKLDVLLRSRFCCCDNGGDGGLLF